LTLARVSLFKDHSMQNEETAMLQSTTDIHRRRPAKLGHIVGRARAVRHATVPGRLITVVSASGL
jgi:hypothetical protein